MEQRSQEWFEKRRGLFTASSIYKLMGVRGLGKTGETYILEKVTESLGVQIPEISTYAMQYGTEMEKFAREYYEMAFNFKVDEVGFIIADWNEFAGCSPDGIINNKKGIEIKCPYNPIHHTENLLIKSQSDLKQLRTEYYWQIMLSLAITGFSEWDFISFHPEFVGMNRMISITVKPDENDIILLKSRIAEAVKIKENYLKIISL